MRFNRNELLFINSITKGKAPFGILLRYPKDEEMDSYKIEVVKSFRQKGLLTESGHFTKAGTALLLLWEEYRNAPRHMIFNRMHLSVNENRRIVGVGYTDSGDYEIVSTDSAVIMTSLLKKFPFLRQEKTKTELASESMSYDDWSAEIVNAKGEILVVGSFLHNAPTEERVFYCINNTPYIYDFNKSVKREISARAMRVRLLEYLSILEGRG